MFKFDIFEAVNIHEYSMCCLTLRKFDYKIAKTYARLSGIEKHF